MCDKLDIYVFIDVDDKGENVENRKKRYCDMLIQVYDNKWPGSTGVQSTGDQCLTSVKIENSSINLLYRVREPGSCESLVMKCDNGSLCNKSSC